MTGSPDHVPACLCAETHVAQVDSAVGAIIDGIARQGKTSQVDVMVVADHVAQLLQIKPAVTDGSLGSERALLRRRQRLGTTTGVT